MIIQGDLSDIIKFTGNENEFVYSTKGFNFLATFEFCQIGGGPNANEFQREIGFSSDEKELEMAVEDVREQIAEYVENELNLREGYSWSVKFKLV